MFACVAAKFALETCLVVEVTGFTLISHAQKRLRRHSRLAWQLRVCVSDKRIMPRSRGGPGANMSVTQATKGDESCFAMQSQGVVPWFQ